jgi:hypothetical protein
LRVIEETTGLQLEKVAASARRLVRLIDAFFWKTVDALDAEGWNSGQTFALRAELMRVAHCAEKTKRRAEHSSPESATGSRRRMRALTAARAAGER